MAVTVTSVITSCEELDLNVKSHWLDTDKVILQLEGHSVTVSARELKAAIDNATNTKGNG